MRPQRGQSTLSALKFGGTLSFRPHRHVRNEKPLTFRMMSPIWRVWREGGSGVIGGAWPGRRATSSPDSAEAGMMFLEWVTDAYACA
jgi:hypothetical protein